MKVIAILATLMVLGAYVEARDILIQKTGSANELTLSTDGVDTVGELSRRAALALGLPAFSTKLTFIGGKQYKPKTRIEEVGAYIKHAYADVDENANGGRVLPIKFFENKKEIARLDVAPTETIGQIKSRLQDVTNRLQSTFSLSFNYEEMDDNKTARDSGLHAGSKVELTPAH